MIIGKYYNHYNSDVSKGNSSAHTATEYSQPAIPENFQVTKISSIINTT